MEENKVLIIKDFGPSIAKVTMSNELVNKLNVYVDNTIKDEKKISNLDHGNNLVGDVTQEFKLEQNFMKESGWGNFLANSVQKWIHSETGKKISKFEILDSWIVRQFKNEFNPTHWHTGHVSGVGYLKVPENLGNQSQKKSATYRGGQLQLIHGTKMFLSKSTINIIPKVGDFYFFPNYLMHTVFPFKDTNEERRSVSFNANINNEIYNVYGK